MGSSAPLVAARTPNDPSGPARWSAAPLSAGDRAAATGRRFRAGCGSAATTRKPVSSVDASASRQPLRPIRPLTMATPSQSTPNATPNQSASCVERSASLAISSRRWQATTADCSFARPTPIPSSRRRHQGRRRCASSAIVKGGGYRSAAVFGQRMSVRGISGGPVDVVAVAGHRGVA
jgi:hypothetical protein